MLPIRISIAVALLFAATGACAEVRIVPQHSGVEVRLRGISAVDGNVAWASGREGTVLRTLDGGRHWQAIVVPRADELDFRDIEGFDAQTAVVLAIGPGEASRVYRTEDGGRSWRLTLQNRDPRAFFDCMAFDGRRGWMLGDPVDGHFQIHATDDGGRDWKLLPDGPPAGEGEAAFAASGTCIARIGTTLVAATGGAQSRIHFRSDRNGGWKRMASGFEAGAESKGVFSVAPLSRSGAFVAVGGDFRAEDEPASAVLFAPVDAGFAAKDLPATPGYRSGVACNDDGTTCIAVGPSGVDAWNGVAWQRVSNVGYDTVDISGDVGWASGDDGRIARIEVGG